MKTDCGKPNLQKDKKKVIQKSFLVLDSMVVNYESNFFFVFFKEENKINSQLSFAK